MARIDRHGAGRAQVDIAQPHHQIAGVVHDAPHLVARGQAVDALDEVHVVRQPGRAGAHGLLVASHRAQRGAVLEGQRQVDHARGHLERGHVGQSGLDLQQPRDQRVLADQAAVVADLQGTHARRQLPHAGHRPLAQRLHQQVDAHAQRQVQHVVAVLQQQVAVARLAVGDRRSRPFGRQRGDDGLGRGGAGRRADGRGGGHGWRRSAQLAQAVVLRRLQRHRLFIVHAHEADAVTRLDLPHLPQLGLGDRDRQTKPPRLGPSRVRITGLSPVKLMLPMAYSQSWMLDGCSPASPPLSRAQSGLGPVRRTPRRLSCSGLPSRRRRRRRWPPA